MNNFKTLISTILIVFLSFFAQGQDTILIYNLTGGKWTVCADMKFFKEYQCDKGYRSYKFFKHGTFKENKQTIYMVKKKRYVKGKWTLEGNTLTIDEDDDKYHKVFPNVYNIIWLDSNRFYTTGQEGPGGPTVYTYFQRTK